MLTGARASAQASRALGSPRSNERKIKKCGMLELMWHGSVPCCVEEGMRLSLFGPRLFV